MFYVSNLLHISPCTYRHILLKSLILLAIHFLLNLFYFYFLCVNKYGAWCGILNL